MKTVFIITIALIASFTSIAQQEFNKAVADARTSYKAGKLDDARFAMQSALQELDIITGKELLKILPQKMEDKAYNAKEDNVSGSTGFFGVVIHRQYGTTDTSNIELEIVGNSPFLGSINALLTMPMMGNNDQKIVKINGYKALISKQNNYGDRIDYEMQLPLNQSLITLKAPGYTQEQLIKMANSLPVAEMAKILQ
jgi:hypothetical protein